MIEQTRQAAKSRKLALKLYDNWVRERQERPKELQCARNKRELEQLRLVNFASQLAEPRQKHLEQLKEVASEMSTADKVALLVMLELPALEISSLLHRLSMQLAARPDATYFAEVNQADNCGSGCG